MSRVAGPAGARVGRVLREAVERIEAAGIATARQDAELLVARVAGTTRLALHLGPTRELAPEPLARLHELLARRCRGEPLQYILGEADFGGLALVVGPGVFIPRPETELLVERALAHAPATGAAVDLGTGSGAVACALAVRRPGLRVWATELDPRAAAWARRNVARLGLGGRVTVLDGDLFAPLAEARAPAAFDVVVSNPPYIATDGLPTLPEEVRSHEPAAALDGGSGGLDVIRRILAAAPAWLRRGGRLCLEVGHDHADPLRAWLGADARYGPPAFQRDFRGHERTLDVAVM